MRGGLTGRPPITTCTCSETLVRLEREKLAVLRGIEGQLERQTALQEEMLQIQRQKLELHRRQLALAEAQFNRPSISVPIILPQDVNHLASRTATLLVSSENMLYCSHGVSHAWTSATPLYRLAGGTFLDEVPAEVNYNCQFPQGC